MNIDREAQRAKEASFRMAALPADVRNAALEQMEQALQAHREQIFRANDADLMREAGNVPEPIYKRLKFGEDKLKDVCKGIRELMGLQDPLFQIQMERELDEGLILTKVSCPLGVIGVIFESRPDALVQISALCVKSGNCVLLKGGREAMETNRALFAAIRDAGLAAGLPEGFLTLLETREDVGELLGCYRYVDLLIPRGSNAFVQYIMANSRIPVMGHADGVCHIYVDRDADIDKAVPVVMDAKTQYVAVCNAVETLLVHKQIAPTFLPALAAAAAGKATLKGDAAVQRIIACEAAEESDFGHEFLDYILAIRVVDDLEEAIDHINKKGSHHTDCIVTENDEAAERFMMYVDSAGVYRNCSTRFADGYRYGFGAEVGISTGKLHARGPVGLEGLVTYKYRLTGKGHIVGDYAEGKKQFHFRDR